VPFIKGKGKETTSKKSKKLEKPLDKLKNLCYNIITVKIKLNVSRKETIMTQREFYNAVINSTDNAELAQFAVEALEKLDARNAKRSSKPSKTQIANEPIIKAIAEVLTSEPMRASEIAETLGISVQKASSLVKKVDGVSVTDVKVKGKGVQKGYFFAE
jgi:hemoglobin-like flavoprotein